MDEDLRSRYRRDFRREAARTIPTRPGRLSPPSPPAAQVPSIPQNIPSSPLPAQPLAAAAVETAEQTLLPRPLEDIPQPRLAKKAVRKHRGRRKGRLKKLLFIIFILLVIGSLGSVGYIYYQNRDVVPKSVLAQANIPILYPAQLPAGFQINKSSFNVTNGNLIAYYADNSAGDRILFTVQAKPSNFDYDTFYSQSLQNADKFTTDLGEGAVGTAQGRVLGSLTTDKTWLIVSGNDNSIDSTKVSFVLHHLKQTD